MCINQWMDKKDKTVVYPHMYKYIPLLRNQNEWPIDAYNINESQESILTIRSHAILKYTLWLHLFIILENEKESIVIESRLLVVGDWRWVRRYVREGGNLGEGRSTLIILIVAHYLDYGCIRVLKQVNLYTLNTCSLL